MQLQWFTAKPNQDKCDAFRHPVQNPNFEQLSPNGTVITPSTRLNYLSPAMDNRLGFETQIAHKVSSAKQRLQLVISTNLCERDSKSIPWIYITVVLTTLSKTEWTHLLATYKRTNTKPLHLFLTKLRSGRLQSYKYRAAVGSYSFIRHYINVCNNSSKR